MKRLEKEKFYASNDIELLFERVIRLTSKYVRLCFAALSYSSTVSHPFANASTRTLTHE